MPQNQNQKPDESTQNFGRVLMEWRAPEYEKQEKSRAWQAASIIIGLVLAGASVAMRDYLLIIVVAMFAIVIYLLHKKEPLLLDVKITDQGAQIGEKFYPYKSLQEFWVIYEPPCKTLNFKSHRAFFPELSAQITDQDPVKIREILLPFLDENPERSEQSTTDRLSRLLKI